MDTTLMHAAIAINAAKFVASLLGDTARIAGPGKWRVGSRGSLAIETKENVLVFFNHEAGVGGDAIDLVAHVRQCTLGDAIRCCQEWTGTPVTKSDRDCLPIHRHVQREADQPRLVLPITDEAAAAWLEGGLPFDPSGSRYNSRIAEEIARWREWPASYVRALAKAGVLAQPCWNGQRTRAAFRIEVPRESQIGHTDFAGLPQAVDAKRDQPQFVGWHARVADGWRFAPYADKEVGRPALPPLPLVLTNDGRSGPIWDKRLLIVTEGEWDCATVPLVAGWWDQDTETLAIPPAVAIIGVLGASAGADTFLTYHRQFFAMFLMALVFRDNDRAGQRWLGPDGFISRLSRSCHRCQCQALGPDGWDKVDVNDAYRARKLNPQIFEALLRRSLGLSLIDVENMRPHQNP